jgi:hypothetical protein
MMHHARALLIRQQTMLASAFRAQLAEFAIRGHARHQACASADRESLRRRRACDRLSALARTALLPLVAQLMELRNAAKKVIV